MSILWPHTRDSLSDSLSSISAALNELHAARPVDIEELMKQFELAAESARNLRSLIAAEMPAASWQTEEELQTVIETIERNVEIRTLRSRLKALVDELEHGEVVHRRASRVSQLNRLREEAIAELRLETELQENPSVLPGPEAAKWVEWACNLKEPEDLESIQILRHRFPELEAFISHLEPGMWIVKVETPV